MANSNGSEQSAANAEVDLGLCWRELIGGVVTVHGGFFSAARCGLIFGPARQAADMLVGGRRLQVLESVLSGAGQNCVAIDLQLAPSTVALHARQALESFGVSGRPSRVHPMLMLMATAARRGLLVSAAVSYLEAEQGELRVIDVPRLGQRLSGCLPDAERAVIDLLVEGRCYAEIAQIRRTAERTVANQIAAAFRRLQVSGRSELIQRLFVLDGLLPAVQRWSSDLPPAPSPVGAPATLPPPTVREPLARRAWRDEARTSGIRPLANLSPQLLDVARAR